MSSFHLVYIKHKLSAPERHFLPSRNMIALVADTLECSAQSGGGQRVKEGRGRFSFSPLLSSPFPSIPQPSPSPVLANLHRPRWCRATVWGRGPRRAPWPECTPCSLKCFSFLEGWLRHSLPGCSQNTSPCELPVHNCPQL